MADERLDRDERKLAELGYKQELTRGWSRFSNFAISFSIISVLAGCFTVMTCRFFARTSVALGSSSVCVRARASPA